MKTDEGIEPQNLKDELQDILNSSSLIMSVTIAEELVLLVVVSSRAEKEIKLFHNNYNRPIKLLIRFS